MEEVNEETIRNINAECIEWDELGKCVKWEKSRGGEIVANFKGCMVKNKGDISDEFRKRVRKGIIIKE